MKLRIATITDAKYIAEMHAVSWRHNYNSVLTKHYLKNIVPNKRDELWKDRLNNPKPNQNVIVADF